MTTAFSLSPLLETSVGFDRFSDLFEPFNRGVDDGYPPYDIERRDEDRFGITLAVAGFTEKDLHITVHDNRLIVAGHKESPASDRKSEVLYQGIATRSFERIFHLADYMIVTSAELKDGLLRLELVRELPEEQKPRKIDIKTGPDQRAIENRRGRAAA